MSENNNARAGELPDPRLQSNATSTRRVLGDVSPNKRLSPAPTAFGNKPIAGSPLKRSFTLEGDQGFRYLKKRKLSTETPLSYMTLPPQQSTYQTLGDSQTSRQTRVIDLGDEDEDGDDSLRAGSIPMIHHAGPTEPNSPAGSVYNEDGDDSSAERHSFSSLINYDLSSQTVAASQHAGGLVFNGPSYAELLRIRLGLAAYKMRTQQIHTPFLDLQVEDTPPSLSEPSTVEEHVALLRREAQMVNERPSRLPFPKLMDAPILRPTAYSSRMVYSSALPSSPPSTVSPERLPHGTTIMTPARTKMEPIDEQELTSSIVKGRVAEGLLGLRNAV